MESTLKQRLEIIETRMAEAAQRAGRHPADIRLVAVSKTKPSQAVREAVRAGIAVVGENYIQEATEKIQALTDLELAWHFIGHLQSNKAKYAVRLFDLIHSVDSIKLARELNKQAAKIDKIQSILVQVNIGEEESKSGIHAGTAKDLVRQISELENLKVLGLMTIPPYFDSPERVRPFFSALKRVRDEIAAEKIPGASLTELSMGMTGDFEAAIEEGATLVRIGTALFGPR